MRGTSLFSVLRASLRVDPAAALATVKDEPCGGANAPSLTATRHDGNERTQVGAEDDLGRTKGWDCFSEPRLTILLLCCRASGRFVFGVFQEAPELAAGGVERALLLFGLVVGEKRTSVISEGGKHNICHRLLPERWSLVQP